MNSKRLVPFRSITILMMFAVLAAVPSSAAAARSIEMVPGCQESFEKRFDVAARVVFDVPPLERIATADARMREMWRLTPLCVGEKIVVGDGHVIQGPKSAGVPIPANVTGLVGRTLRMHKPGKRPHGKAARTGYYSDCSVTAWSPQFPVGSGQVRTGGETTCSTYHIPLKLDTRTQVHPGGYEQGQRFSDLEGTYITQWGPYGNCYDSQSYRGWAWGFQGVYAAQDTTSYFASPDAYCY